MKREKKIGMEHGQMMYSIRHHARRARALFFPLPTILPPKKSVKKGNTKVLCSKSTFPTINLSEDSKQNFHLVTQKSTQKCSCLVRQDEDETLREIQSSPTQKIFVFIAEKRIVVGLVSFARVDFDPVFSLFQVFYCNYEKAFSFFLEAH